jgi:hypothetical protein
MPTSATMGERPDIHPDPDPTDRTNEQIKESVFAVMAVVNEKFGRVFERFDGNDKAIAILAETQSRLPNIGMVDADVKHLAELTRVQIAGITTLIEKTAELNNTALQAAFATSEKAVLAAQTASALANTKMENTFTGNFQQINQLITTLQESFRREIGDLRKVQDDKAEEIKKQFQASEARSNANEGQKKGQHDSWALLVATITVIVSIAMTIAAFVFHH